MLAGCVQPALAPNTNIMAANLLDRLGLEVIEMPGSTVLWRRRRAYFRA